MKNKTLANLSSWDGLRIEAFKKMLRGEFDGVCGVPEVGESFGTLFFLKKISDDLGISSALGKKDRSADLSLFLIFARLVHQGSRLSSVRWSKGHAVSDILGLGEFDENHLYRALEWLELHQGKIEQRLYKRYLKEHGNPPVMLLYDVTSSYFEGDQNELSDYGYNRDGKKGKKQIVIGLLTDHSGEPLAVRVFKGNTSDPSTISEQIQLMKTDFGIEHVVLIGDKGMIRNSGKERLTSESWDYITSLNKVEIRSLEKQGVIQYDLFEEEICEVSCEGTRYILRRNDAITRHLIHERAGRVERLRSKVAARNDYVASHPKATVETGLRTLSLLAKEWRLDGFIRLEADDRSIVMSLDEEARESLFKLDGCYVIETKVSDTLMDKHAVDEAYHYLHEVESCFRNMKTTLLEVRPIFLRKSNRTKGHVLVCMLALKIARYIRRKLKEAYGTNQQGLYHMTLKQMIAHLDKLSFLYYKINDQRVARISQPDQTQLEIFQLFGLTIPAMTKT